MDDKFQYRLTQNQKVEIAQNLIDILQNDVEITQQTRTFIGNWILTDHTEKRKAFYDVWDIVLKNYLPETRPVLFRACDRISRNGKIASFTGQLECARRFSDCKGSLIVCDTKDTLKLDEQFRQPGEYKQTFYPIVSVLKKAKARGGCGFSERILNDYIGEDEYIMRIELGNMYGFRWINKDM